MSPQAPYSRKHGSQPESPWAWLDERGALQVGGYQKFALGSAGFERLEPVHRLKYELVAPYVARLNAKEALADIGCAAGAIGLQIALGQGRPVAFVDHDEEYIGVVRKCVAHLALPGCEWHVASLATVPRVFPAGVAFALVHWIYSYSEAAGSLDRAVALLSRVAERHLFVEWVEPDDSAIRAWRHTEQNRETIVSPYRKDLFLEALRTHYGHFELLGRVSSTRSIWYASTQPVKPGRLAGAIGRIRVLAVRLDWLRRRVLARLGYRPAASMGPGPGPGGGGRAPGQAP